MNLIFRQPTKKSLNLLLQNNFSSKGKIYIFEGGRQSTSGIRATIFGATGFLGPYVGAVLGQIGSELIFPHSHRYTYDDEVKELKLTASSGHAAVIKEMDFDDPHMLDVVIKNSNVVINLCGPRRWCSDLVDIEDANLKTAVNIAKACNRAPGVKRLIQFSACGADLNSPSLDWKTKAQAEQEVLNIFPDATILRLATVYGMNDYFIKTWQVEREFYYHFNLVFDDCQARRQPIFCNDIAQCVLNALKLPESCGETYEIGGPHTYTRKECYEIFQNIVGRPPKLVYFPKEVALWLTKNISNWEYFCHERIVKDGLDSIVNPNAKTVKDLYVQPVAFHSGIEGLFKDFCGRFPGPRDFHER